jgi:hypothetical protein
MVAAFITGSVPDPVPILMRRNFTRRHSRAVDPIMLTTLSKLVSEFPRTRVTWVFQQWGEILELVDEDPLPGRSALAEKALRLTASPPLWLTLLENAEVECITAERGKSIILRQRSNRFTRHADEIVAAVGYRPDESVFSPLGGRPDCACANETRNVIDSQTLHLPGTHTAGPAGGQIVTVAPGYYLLGAKSCGSNTNFLLRAGHLQVSDAIADILERVVVG